MRFVRSVIVAGVTVVGLAACTPQQFAQVAARTHPNGDVVTVVDGQPVPDVRHGQRLDVVMSSGLAGVDKCRDMGGEPIWWGAPVDVLVCEGVDF